MQNHDDETTYICANSSGDAIRPTRRSALRMGVAAATLPLIGVTDRATAASGSLSARKFDRGINAWPWFSFPIAFPSGGAAYSVWPPYNASRPTPRAADLMQLAAAGFDFIRLPVDPAPLLYLLASNQTQQFWLLISNICDAVSMASAAGLGVIVNLQPEAVPGYTPENLYGLSASAGNFNNYNIVVACLALQLGNLKIDRLALEPVNEPPQQVIAAGGVSVAIANAGAADWATKQMTLLTSARKYAPSLKLVVTGGSGGSIGGLIQLDPKTFVSLSPVLFTFHFYDPYLFSHQGAPWIAASDPTYGWLNSVPWPAAAGSLSQTMAAVKSQMLAQPMGYNTTSLQSFYNTIQSRLGPYFNPPIDYNYFINDVATGNYFFGSLANWATKNGLGPEMFLMGEFGALKTSTLAMPVTGGPYVAATAADRSRYISDVRVTAENHGYGWSMWTLFNPGMGIMDETTRTLDATVVASLGLTMPH